MSALPSLKTASFGPSLSFSTVVFEFVAVSNIRPPLSAVLDALEMKPVIEAYSV